MAQTNSPIIFNRPVYFVSSPEDSSVLIALDVKINDDSVSWFDTVKDRIMYIGKILDNNPEHFVFQRNDKGETGIYTFVPMTLEIYNQRVKNRILIQQDFSREEEMLKAFQETKNNAW